jgi:hypothetical protein
VLAQVIATTNPLLPEKVKTFVQGAAKTLKSKGDEMKA